MEQPNSLHLAQSGNEAASDVQAVGHAPRTVRALTKLARELADKFVFTADVAGEVSATLNAGDTLAAELERRNKEDPRTRLHNLCEAISTERDGSEFSREEWERIDAENAALRTSHAELVKALERCENVMTYAEATVAPGNWGKRDGEWVLVHAGRAGSSHTQLRAAIDAARAALDNARKVTQ